MLCLTVSRRTVHGCGFFFDITFDLAVRLPAEFKQMSAAALRFVQIAEERRFTFDSLMFVPGSDDHVYWSRQTDEEMTEGGNAVARRLFEKLNLAKPKAKAKAKAKGKAKKGTGMCKAHVVPKWWFLHCSTSVGHAVPRTGLLLTAR